MKITSDETYRTRIFHLEDNEELYTATYSEDIVFYKWDVIDEDNEDIDISSELGKKIINLCEEKIKLENTK
jgi:hypothetical protein